MRKAILFLLLFIAGRSSQAQLENTHWMFSYRNGLHFYGGTVPNIARSELYSVEGGASVSSGSGNLLFYTDGLRVWDRSHNFMPNGTGLAGGQGSATQAALIVPRGKSERWYYIFTVDEGAGPLGLRYSLVDMQANMGQGDVVEKNTPLLSIPVAEKLTAIRHCNQRDYWVITTLHGGNTYYAYLVTETGIASPVISNSGPLFAAFTTSMVGELRGSPNGKKLAAAIGATGFVLHDFDNSTGIVSNGATIFTANGGFPYGVCFSPNSSLLYTTIRSNVDPDGRRRSSLLQFDVTLPDTRSITNSCYVVAASTDKGYSSLQLTPDGQLYTAVTGFTYVSAVLTPDVPGIDCQFAESVVTLPFTVGSGLPNFPNDGVTAKSSFSFFPANPCPARQVDFSFDPEYAVTNVLWDFGDPASGPQNSATTPDAVHSYAQEGTYTVTLIVYSPCGNDTLTREIKVDGKLGDLGPDRTICEQSYIFLDAGYNQNNTYAWQDGSEGPGYTARTEGWYWVDISNAAGCTMRDSLYLTVVPSPVRSLPRHAPLCVNQSLMLDAGNPGATYIWNNGNTDRQITVNDAGRYIVEITLSGCSVQDTTEVETTPLPEFTLGPDQYICPGTQLILDPLITNGNFRWQDGSSGTTYTATREGQYYLEVSNGCGSHTDTITLRTGPCGVYIPSAFSPDGNGLNDFFRISGAHLVEGFNMRIYNRDGQLLFSTADKNKGWDGRYKGQPLPVGVYVYQLSYSLAADGKRINTKGTIALLR